MAKKQKVITAEMLREAYIANLEAKRKPNAEAIADFTEKELDEFIRRHESASFAGVYECLDHNFYDRIRSRIATSQAMRDEDDASGNLYYIHLRTYSQFLESKAFKSLFKQKINIEGKVNKPSVQPQHETVQEPSVPQFREETEGERTHKTKEVDVVYRNPQLRQQCLDRYGYQCQCCGMDFAELYGEELGANFIEVHHLKMISTFEKDGVPDNFLENLVPLCSNCHSMIHHIKCSEHPLRDLREAYHGPKKEITTWKED